MRSTPASVRCRPRRSRPATGFRPALRAAGSTDEDDAADLQGSALVDDVVRPLLGDAEGVLLKALSRINVEVMTRRAESLK